MIQFTVKWISRLKVTRSAEDEGKVEWKEWFLMQPSFLDLALDMNLGRETKLRIAAAE
jgi:hypothetical protein